LEEQEDVSAFEEYEKKYECVRLTRNDGILLVELHSGGKSLVWNEVSHRELGYLFADIATDPDNRVAILTGCGDDFCSDVVAEDWDLSTPKGWDTIYWEGRRLIQNYLDMPVPMIGAVNGPALVHAELAVLCDVVLASDTAEFQDAAHFSHFGAVPGDGTHLVWPLLLGMTRGRYFLITGQKITSGQALDLGIVNEVMPRDELMPRAFALAEQIASQPPLAVRYTRVAINMMLKNLLGDGLSHGLALEGLSVIENQRQSS
jgi:enoyl-CoA hydratase/carnithine racemase